MPLVESHVSATGSHVPVQLTLQKVPNESRVSLFFVVCLFGPCVCVTALLPHCGSRQTERQTYGSTYKYTQLGKVPIKGFVSSGPVVSDCCFGSNVWIPFITPALLMVNRFFFLSPDHDDLQYN